MNTHSFKKLLPILIVLSFFIVSNCEQSKEQPKEQAERQLDDTDNMIGLSQLIIGTIGKYDPTEKGVIPLKRYHQFLHQIFVQGNKFNKLSQQDKEVPQDVSTLLREATKEFTRFRYEQPVLQNQQDQNEKREKQQKELQKREFVELQQFYMDLIKHFSEFLDLEENQQRFKLVNDYFFQREVTSQDSNPQDNQKLEL